MFLVTLCNFFNEGLVYGQSKVFPKFNKQKTNKNLYCIYIICKTLLYPSVYFVQSYQKRMFFSDLPTQHIGISDFAYTTHPKQDEESCSYQGSNRNIN